MNISKEIKSAIFVLTTILLFIFGFNYLKGTSLIDKQKTVYAVYDEVDGLLVGANVMINGLSIGNVTALDFLPNSTKIVVTLKVKDKINFSSNSTATIYETGVLGGLAIAIEPIFEKGIVVKSGDTLKSSIRPGLTELINRQIEPLQRKLDKLCKKHNPNAKIVHRPNPVNESKYHPVSSSRKREIRQNLSKFSDQDYVIINVHVLVAVIVTLTLAGK